ncbi:MAG: DUF2782 domain-containing protein [Gammaproteobacteria bacterium]|nr:DUF2782 domain-containing protein [Gammaproteobacteria bacterium]MBU1416028.1 DUF2782 domain-containing protein [Gammaproteobacteria bacterium]
MRRRILIPSLLILLGGPALAQQRPADLQPLPEVPPPPPMVDDGSPEPEVTITKRGEDKVEEYRVNGRLYMMKVTPPHGIPYYLIDNQGDGKWSRADGIESGLRVPMWVIKTF